VHVPVDQAVHLIVILKQFALEGVGEGEGHPLLGGD
jgi:hypothetical protein